MLNNSLKTRIIFSILGILIFSLLSTTLFFGYRAKLEMADTFETYAKDHRDMTRNYVESQYDSILYHKAAILERRKIELKSNMNIVFYSLQNIYEEYLNGEKSEEKAKKDAIKLIEKIRYNNDIGYIWINDITTPYPKMIMHPTLPELNNKILDSPEFNCALGIDKNLFIAAVEVCMEKGEGYLDYLWPKPTENGLTEKQAKLSFVKIFKEWNWILGTGMYIDDLEEDVLDRVDEVINELNNTIAKHGVGKSGYSFIFNENNQMLVHPNKRGVDSNLLIDPGTGKNLLDELKEQALYPDEYLEYLWDKPDSEGDYIYLKRSYVTYYEPLHWYIGTTFYKDDFEQRISNLTGKIILFSVIFLTLAFFISWYVSRSIIKPLNNLINSIRNTDEFGIPVNITAGEGTREILILSSTMNKMLESISQSKSELIKHKQHLEDLVNERTKELNLSLEELKCTKDHLIQSEKMAALGGLVAGVAHEINTPIGIAVTAASHLEEQTLIFNEKYSKDLLTYNDFENYINIALTSSKMLLSNVNRAAEFIQSFKLIAVDQSSESMRHFNVKSYIEDILQSLYPKLKNTNHKIKINCDDKLVINSYPGALSQIITNLVLNSIIHGFENIKDGEITIDIIDSADKLEIIYKDNGIGIPEENITKIFDPFFTTKRSEGNSGLGLNIVYNIVTRTLGGEIKCRKIDNKGIMFVLSFSNIEKDEEI